MTGRWGWRVGDYEIIPIVESQSAFTPEFLAKVLLPQAQPQVLKDLPWLFPHWVDEAWGMRFVTQSFLVRGPAGVGLVDTCLGNDKVRRHPQFHQLQEPWLERLAEAGVTPEEVDWVLCTHLHVDHVGWNTRWVEGRWVPTFPKARYLFVGLEWENVIAQGKSEYFLSDSVRPVIEAGLAEFVDWNAQIGPGLKLEPTPGHTQAHVSLKVTSEQHLAWISGDALHHPCQVAHPEWSSRADSDPTQAEITRKALLECVWGQGGVLIGTHFASPAAGRLKKVQAGFIFEGLAPIRLE